MAGYVLMAWRQNKHNIKYNYGGKWLLTLRKYQVYDRYLKILLQGSIFITSWFTSRSYFVKDHWTCSSINVEFVVPSVDVVGCTDCRIEVLAVDVDAVACTDCWVVVLAVDGEGGTDWWFVLLLSFDYLNFPALSHKSNSSCASFLCRHYIFKISNITQW